MIDDDNTQRITMSMYGPKGQSIEVSMIYSEDVTWMRIAEQFHSFLCAMGYAVDAESVGARY